MHDDESNLPNGLRPDSSIIGVARDTLPSMSPPFRYHVAAETRKVLNQLEAVGWIISVFHLPESLKGRIGKTTEMHAVHDNGAQHVRSVPEWSMASDLECAVKLFAACGVI